MADEDAPSEWDGILMAPLEEEESVGDMFVFVFGLRWCAIDDGTDGGNMLPGVASKLPLREFGVTLDRAGVEAE